MGSLPTFLVDPVTGQKLERQTVVEAGLCKNEKAFDALLIEQMDVLSDLLIENKVLRYGSRLKFIGEQIRGVDVLFAEVDDDEDEEPSRLVLVEDKLLKNPQSKRKVLGQIIEYAALFADSVRSNTLIDDFPKHKEWIEANSDLLDRQLERGDFLLLICGDSIHSNVADIVGRMFRRIDRHPTLGMEMCLVAMDVFVNDTQHFLAPHLVGRVIQAERHMSISVEVKDAGGKKIDAQIKSKEIKGNEQQSSKPKASRTQEQFFAAWTKKVGKEPVDQWKLFVEKIGEADIPGLSIVPIWTGKPTVQFRSTVLEGMIPILRIRSSEAAIKDVMSTKLWENNKKAALARDQFRQAALKIPGTAKSDKNVTVIPMKILATKWKQLIEALEHLGEALDAR